MGCTLNYTLKDHQQVMKLIRDSEAPFKTLDKERREQIRSALHRSSSGALLLILRDPHHPAYQAVSNLLAKSVESRSKMTDSQRQKLPEAFRIILEKQPNAMGLFKKVPSHRAPGSSPVGHQYEIFSAAALILVKHHTESGKVLSIGPGDRVDFGMKFAGGYAQPKRYGTIEADILVSKGSIMSHKTVAIDSKYSSAGRYGPKSGLQRQLNGIRSGFRDGKIDEFCFVTNGVFDQSFTKMVEKENLQIAMDYGKIHNRLYHDEKHGLDRKYLTEDEKRNIPPGKIPVSFFRGDNEKVKEFVRTYNIKQIDICQHVIFSGT